MIGFYRATGPYGYLSNLYPAPMVFEGRAYSCAEYAYQSGKPIDPQVREWMSAAPTASLCAQLAHSLFPWQVVPNWSEIKVDRMRLILREKFRQNREMIGKLLATGDEELVEESKSDAFWGVGKNGKGKNMLGKLLMELRQELRS